jgi:hypothetical protein
MVGEVAHSRVPLQVEAEPFPQSRRVEDRSGGAAAATQATTAPATTARTGANANILRRMVGLFSG